MVRNAEKHNNCTENARPNGFDVQFKMENQESSEPAE